MSDKNICPTCNGRGHLRRGLGYKECPTCSGSFIVVTEDKKIKGKVEGVNASEVAEVMKSVIHSDKNSGVNINVSNSNVGVINAGDMKNIKSISNSVASLVKSDDFKVAQAFSKLSKAVAYSKELSTNQRSEILDLLEEMAIEAGKKPENRLNKSAIKAIFASIATGVGIAGGLAEVWSTWGPIISGFFGIN